MAIKGDIRLEARKMLAVRYGKFDTKGATLLDPKAFARWFRKARMPKAKRLAYLKMLRAPMEKDDILAVSLGNLQTFDGKAVNDVAFVVTGNGSVFLNDIQRLAVEAWPSDDGGTSDGGGAGGDDGGTGGDDDDDDNTIGSNFKECPNYKACDSLGFCSPQAWVVREDEECPPPDCGDCPDAGQEVMDPLQVFTP